MARDIPSILVYGRCQPVFGRFFYYLLKFLGVEIPLSVQIGQEFELAHGGVGVVVHPNTKIGDRVKIYPGVTIGRADIQYPIERSEFVGIEIGDNVILSPGSKVLCKQGILIVGRGSIVAANAVLLESTGEAEIWAGVPAKRVGTRESFD